MKALAVLACLLLAGCSESQPKTLERVCVEQEIVQVLLPRIVPTGKPGQTRMDYVPTWLMECKRYTTIVRPEGSP